MSADKTVPIVRSTHVSRTPADAFRIFTTEIGAWWPLPSHGAYGSASGGLAFRDGLLVEMSTNGEEAIWGEVILWDEPHRLVFTWHPGAEANPASEVDIEFIEDANGTRVVLEHRGWESFGAEAMARRRNYIGPGAWGEVLDHFADIAEPRQDAADLTELAAAYEAFFAEAERAGSQAATDGEWNARQVIAHVALNDAAMLAVTQAIVHRQTTVFANVVAQDRANLDRWIARFDDLASAIAAGRTVATQLIAALGRLSAEQQATGVHCTLTNDGETMLDDERPWIAIAAEVQARFHLPSHTSQLAELRRATATR